MRRSLLPRDEAGVVLPTRVLALAVSALALGGLLLVANNPDDAGRQGTPAAKPVTATRTSPSPSAPAASQTPKPKPIKRGKVIVEVFNNSSIHGLAGKTADKAKLAGWNVVGTDNWYGTVDTTTVYFPPNLKAAAALLARDLGIKKLRPAENPMRLDRLTVILTADYHG